MIIEIPDADDFLRASLNLLNLAWEIAVYTLRDWDRSEVMNPTVTPDFKIELNDGTVEHIEGEKDPWTDDERVAAEMEFWRRCQPALGNALSLIQQSLEMAVKSRIAEVSPFLLIVRDPRDYPRNAAKEDIPFSAFRSIDAADLVRVHDAVCADRLGDAFAQFWDLVRRERNAIIHCVSTRAPIIRPERLMSITFLVSTVLHGPDSWFSHRLRYALSDETHIAFRTDPKVTYAKVLDELKDAIESLNPAFMKRHLGLDPRSRSYSCVACRADADDECWHDWELGQTAQLRPKKPTSTSLHCVLCRRQTQATRALCPNETCRSTELCGEPGPFFLHCLTCGREPDEAEEDEPANSE